MRIAILNYEYAVATCVTGPAEIWTALALTVPQLTGSPLKYPIAIDYVRADNGDLWRKAMDTGKEEQLTADNVYDLVIIPAMRSAKIDDVLNSERRLIDWLGHQHDNKADLASICI